MLWPQSCVAFASGHLREASFLRDGSSGALQMSSKH